MVDTPYRVLLTSREFRVIGPEGSMLDRDQVIPVAHATGTHMRISGGHELAPEITVVRNPRPDYPEPLLHIHGAVSIATLLHIAAWAMGAGQKVDPVDPPANWIDVL